MREQSLEQRAALCDQLGILDESVKRVLVILVGVALSLYALLLQRGQLRATICGETPPEQPVFPLRLVSALLILSSLFYFTCLSRRTLCQTPPTAPGRCSAELDACGNLLVIAVALSRLWDLLRTEANAAGDTGAPVHPQ